MPTGRHVLQHGRLATHLSSVRKKRQQESESTPKKEISLLFQTLGAKELLLLVTRKKRRVRMGNWGVGGGGETGQTCIQSTRITC